MCVGRCIAFKIIKTVEFLECKRDLMHGRTNAMFVRVFHLSFRADGDTKNAIDLIYAHSKRFYLLLCLMQGNIQGSLFKVIFCIFV